MICMWFSRRTNRHFDSTCVFFSSHFRDDVAELVVGSLINPKAAGLTFEVKSDLPFSTLWEEVTGRQPRDYR